MANYAYFIVLAATVVVPLVLSMVPWRLRWSAVEWRRLMRVFAFVSVPFVLLDMYSYARGWWAYNPHFVIDARMGGLPIEEIMFFFVVPFACLYLFSAFTKAGGGEPLQRPWIWRLVLSLIMVAAMGLAIIEPKERTLFDVVLFALVGLKAFLMPPKRTAALWLVAVVGLFLVVNTVLTGLPIVTYNPDFGSRYRIGTIPFEDVLYNFSFLLLCLGVWCWRPITRLTQVVRRV